MRNQITRGLAESSIPFDPVSDAEKQYDQKLLRSWFRLPLKPAAVLIPIVERESNLSIMFTLRREGLSNHSGQISFPGGQPHSEDKDLLDTALRESNEEIGLKMGQIEVVGNLQPQAVITGFAVVPFVGFVDECFTPFPQPSEVAKVFEVPLDHLLDEKSSKKSVRTRNNIDLPMWEYLWEDQLIWGATAQMLNNLINNYIK
ncbi:MAG: CoA pyrophosphatase [Pseudomonadota bacterium]|nr:CoA pyrophosphatase [Pseudomonadota bacterium]